MDFLIDTLASAMSGTRFSGIAVAAANRRALVNQEREAAQRDAAHVKTLNAKEEALLASIRNQLLGGGKKTSGGGGAPGVASAKHRASSTGSGSERPKSKTGSKAKRVTEDGVKQYDDLDDLEDDEDEGGDGDPDGERAAVRGGERAESPPAPAGEKRFMSKAERKRLKKQRMQAKESPVARERSEPKASAGDAGTGTGTGTGTAKKAEKRKKRADDDAAARERRNDSAPPRKKKKKRKADAPRPPSPTWPPRRRGEDSES
jgi:hypothetical protein